MKNTRDLADKVIKTHIKNLDGKVDCYHHSQLISLLNRQAKSSGYIQVEVNKSVGIISYPHDSSKINRLKEIIDREGFKASKMEEPPFYYEELNLIVPNMGNHHTLTMLWELTKKEQKITINVEKMNLPDYFLEFMMIDKKNKTANDFRLCDVEIEFMLALQIKDRRVRIIKYISTWMKNIFAKFVYRYLKQKKE
jgi:hypothetical protein